jgi:hypothetical protein
VSKFAVCLEIFLPPVDLRLIILDTSVMLLSDQQNVSVIFDIIESLQAKLIILHDCSITGRQFFIFGPEQRQNRSVLNGNLPCS